MKKFHFDYIPDFPSLKNSAGKKSKKKEEDNPEKINTQLIPNAKNDSISNTFKEKN